MLLRVPARLSEPAEPDDDRKGSQLGDVRHVRHHLIVHGLRCGRSGRHCRATKTSHLVSQLRTPNGKSWCNQTTHQTTTVRGARERHRVGGTMVCCHKRHRGDGGLLVSSRLRLRRCDVNAGVRVRVRVLILMRVRHVVRRCRVYMVRR